MKGVAGKDGMGGPAVILIPGAVKGVEEYPATLQELVLNYLCKNLDEICVTKPVITTPKRRRVHSGPNHCFASEMDLDDELQLLERVSGQNTNSYTDEVRAENLQERGKLSIITANYILSFLL